MKHKKKNIFYFFYKKNLNCLEKKTKQKNKKNK